MMFCFFQAEDGIRDYKVTEVQTCALPISLDRAACCAAQSKNPYIRMRDECPRQCLCADSAAAVPGAVLRRRRLFHGAGRSEERRVGKECRSRWSGSR